MAPIFTGPAGVGVVVGVVVGVSAAVGVAVGVGVGPGVAVCVGVAVTTGVAIRVAAGVRYFSLPQANNTGTSNASTKNKAANLCHNLVFPCLILSTSQLFSSRENHSSNPPASHMHVGMPCRTSTSS
jgi:hypothetical protein